MNEIHDNNVLFGRRKPLPNDRPDLLQVLVNKDHQIGSYTVSFSHRNTHGHVAHSLEAELLAM
jgi:hypothetical protein